MLYKKKKILLQSWIENILLNCYISSRNEIKFFSSGCSRVELCNIKISVGQLYSVVTFNCRVGSLWKPSFAHCAIKKKQIYYWNRVTSIEKFLLFSIFEFIHIFNFSFEDNLKKKSYQGIQTLSFQDITYTKWKIINFQKVTRT